MLVLEIELLAGRYHATPWGRAANEGDVEWPPAPWRIARALVDAWWRSPVDDRPDEAMLDAALAALAGPARFVLPPAVPGQTRHYMPKADRRAAGDTVLVLDAFVRVDDDRPLVQVIWDAVELDDDTCGALGKLLPRISYLGRAESPCLLRLVDEPDEAGTGVEPLGEAGEVPAEADVVPVLCLGDHATVAELSISTAALRARRVVRAPAARSVPYVRPRRALEPERRVSPTRERARLVAVRYAIQGAAPVPIADAIRLSELLRRAALSRMGTSTSEDCLLLRGVDPATGEPRKGHLHAHYLATDEDGDGRIDHLAVWCPAGLGAAGRQALDLHRLSSGLPFLPYPFAVLPLHWADGDVRSLDGGPFGASAQWRTQTPFIPTRHRKVRNGEIRDDWLAQVRDELGRRGVCYADGTSGPVAADEVAVRLLPVRPGPAERRPAWGAFRRERHRERRTAGVPALGVELEFARPVVGPICLGRNAHFGMGLFLPMRVP